MTLVASAMGGKRTLPGIASIERWTGAEMRTLSLLARAAMILGSSCSPRLEEPLRANCGYDPECIQIAFTGFRGESAELLMNGEVVFRGTLQTANWTDESSGSAEFRSPDLTHISLRIGQKIVYERAVTERGVRTIYVGSREPYVLLTDHPGPLLD